MDDLIVKNVNLFGDDIIAAQDKDGKIWAAVKWLCEGIGLSEGQTKNERKKIQEDLALCEGGRNLTLPTNGGMQEVLCLKLEYVPLWLAKISITPTMRENNPELVDKLVKYQLEAKDILAEAFMPQYEMTINRSALSPQMQMLMGMVESQARQELEQKRQAEQLNRIEKKQETIVTTFTDTSGEDDFKAWTNRCIGKIAESPKYTNGTSRSARYQNARAESYDRLNRKRACRLTQRVAYAKEMALQNGATKSAANAINRLTVISADKDLKPVYETVIKEMMIYYCVDSE